MTRTLTLNNKKEKAPYFYSLINDSNHTKAKGTLRDILYIAISMKFQNRHYQQMEKIIRRAASLGDDRLLISEGKKRTKAILTGLSVFLKAVSYMSAYFENSLICTYSDVKRSLHIHFTPYFKIHMCRCGHDEHVRIYISCLTMMWVPHKHHSSLRLLDY